MSIRLACAITTKSQGRRQRETSARPPFQICAPPFHVWPPGCCMHPIFCLRNVDPLWVLAPFAAKSCRRACKELDAFRLHEDAWTWFIDGITSLAHLTASTVGSNPSSTTWPKLQFLCWSFPRHLFDRNFSDKRTRKQSKAILKTYISSLIFLNAEIWKCKGIRHEHRPNVDWNGPGWHEWTIRVDRWQSYSFWKLARGPTQQQQWTRTLRSVDISKRWGTMRMKVFIL